MPDYRDIPQPEKIDAQNLMIKTEQATKVITL